MLHNLYFSTNLCTFKFGNLISVNRIRTSMQITVYKPNLLVFVLTLYFHLCSVIRIVVFNITMNILCVCVHL